MRKNLGFRGRRAFNATQKAYIAWRHQKPDIAESDLAIHPIQVHPSNKAVLSQTERVFENPCKRPKNSKTVN